MKNNPSIFFGISLILIGFIFLTGNLLNIEVWKFWPVIILFFSFYFLFLFISNPQNYGLLVPFGIFLTISFIFGYCTFWGWHNMKFLWPLFIAAPGVGLFLTYIAGDRTKNVLLSSAILMGLGVVFIFITTGFHIFWPILLIVIGILLLLKK